MSLYHEAAAILHGLSEGDDSLKSRVYNRRDLKSSPGQLFALVSETLRWNEVLVEVIERSDLLGSERRVTPALALLLVHDLLLSRGGIALPSSHPLRVATEKHRTRLSAELTRLRSRRGLPSIEALRARLGTSNVNDAGTSRPRWIRVNTLRSSVDEQLRTTFASYSQATSLEQVMRAAASDRVLHVDGDVPDLLALPARSNLTSTPAYRDRQIILQDKASCLPPYLLDPQSLDGDVLDACAAPGNKTTQLAALVARRESGGHSHPRVVHAIEKDLGRAKTLYKMVASAGAMKLASIRPGQDFLRLDPDDGPWRKVTALLLDPSCSGSGIVDRGKVPSLRLPSTSPRSPQAKRKPERRKTKKQAAPSATTMSEQVPMHEEELGTSLADRLTSLATFQLKLLTHALRFPAARRITYSTCSIYAQENEHVVAKALSSPIAMDRGWRMLRREEQVAGARGWNARGDAHALIETEGGEQIAEACIRCNKDDGQGTMGFFVAAFVRDEGIPKGLQTPTEEHAGKGGEDVEEWQGFSSADEGRSAASKAKSKRQRIR